MRPPGARGGRLVDALSAVGVGEAVDPLALSNLSNVRRFLRKLSSELPKPSANRDWGSRWRLGMGKVKSTRGGAATSKRERARKKLYEEGPKPTVAKLEGRKGTLEKKI